MLSIYFIRFVLIRVRIDRIHVVLKLRSWIPGRIDWTCPLPACIYIYIHLYYTYCTIAMHVAVRRFHCDYAPNRVAKINYVFIITQNVWYIPKNDYCEACCIQILLTFILIIWPQVYCHCNTEFLFSLYIILRVKIRL